MSVKVGLANGVIGEITTDLGYYSDDPYSDHESVESYVEIKFSNGDRFYYDVRPAIDPVKFVNYLYREDDKSNPAAFMKTRYFSNKTPIQFCLDFIDTFCWSNHKIGELGNFTPVQTQIISGLLEYVDIDIELTDSTIHRVAFTYKDMYNKEDGGDTVKSVEILFADGDSVWVEFDIGEDIHKRRMFDVLVDIVRESRAYRDKVTKAVFVNHIIQSFRQQTVKRRFGDHNLYNSRYFCRSKNETVAYECGIIKDGLHNERETMLVPVYFTDTLEDDLRENKFVSRYVYLDH